MNGETLRTVRRIRGLKQSELAKLSGLSQTSISYIENGIITPSETQQDALRAALGISHEQKERLTTLVRHTRDLKRLELTCQIRIREVLQHEDV